MSSPYRRKDKNQSNIPTSSSNTEKDIDFDLESLAKLRSDYPSNPMIVYLNINFKRNKIVQLTDICKTFLIEVHCIDETKLDSRFLNAQVNLPD